MKGKLKKVFSIFAAFAFVFSLAMTNVNAETTGTITVDNPISENDNYEAFRILDAAIDEKESSKTSYSIKSNSPWYDFVKDNAAFTLTEGKKETTNGVTVTTYYVTSTTIQANNDAAKLATEIIAYYKANKDVKEFESYSLTYNEATKQFSVSGLPLGYYFVKSDTGALCNLTTTNPNATIHNKNNVHFDKSDDVDDKKPNNSSAEVGQSVNYTLTGKVPDTTGFTEYFYLFTDKMSEGLDFNKDIKVYIDGVEYTNDKNLVSIIYDGVNPSDPSKEVDFMVGIDVMSLQNKVGKNIEVKYTAVVNENAINVKPTENKATLTYSNDPTNTESFDHKDDKEQLFSTKIVIDKFDSTGESKKLKGATFVLQTTKETTAETKYYKLETVDGKQVVSWVDDIEEATSYTTDDNGAAEFIGLKNGTYYLRELEAPDGYNLMTETQKVKINGYIGIDGQNTGEVVLDFSATANVPNGQGTELPETGGMGTTMIYLVGSGLVLLSAVLLVTRKRVNG